MTEYRFYSKLDRDRETILCWPAKTKEEAIERFAEIKKLSIEKFINLFIVEKR